MDRLQAMRVFVKVVETGGFSSAARELLISPPGITRAITMLEEAIGTKLLMRTTRSVKMTEAGARYYEDCRRILSDIDEAEAAAAGSYATPTGMLTVSAPVLFGELHVLPVVTEYLDQHPAITIRTLFVDRVVNLIDEGVDVAVRIGHLPNSNLRAILVGHVRRVLCASPCYLSVAGTPMHPADLGRHSLIASIGAWTSLEWQFANEHPTSISIRPRLLCNTNGAAIAATLAGKGISRVLSYQIDRETRSGQLQILMPDYEEAPLPIHVVYGEGRQAPAKVRAFVDLAVRRLREAKHTQSEG